MRSQTNRPHRTKGQSKINVQCTSTACQRQYSETWKVQSVRSNECIVPYLTGAVSTRSPWRPSQIPDVCCNYSTVNWYTQPSLVCNYIDTVGGQLFTADSACLTSNNPVVWHILTETMSSWLLPCTVLRKSHSITLSKRVLTWVPLLKLA